jgi:hypothetical protein
MRCFSALPMVLLLMGCASEQVTYERNLHPNHISRHARLLPQTDREQVARMMAHRTRQAIICLCAGRGENQGLLFAYTGSNGSYVPGGYGFFVLKKTDGLWRIVEKESDPRDMTTVPCLLCSDDQ